MNVEDKDVNVVSKANSLACNASISARIVWSMPMSVSH
jgi:hypothetical protein